jgi:hypothetical protein
VRTKKKRSDTVSRRGSGESTSWKEKEKAKEKETAVK